MPLRRFKKRTRRAKSSMTRQLNSFITIITFVVVTTALHSGIVYAQAGGLPPTVDRTDSKTNGQVTRDSANYSEECLKSGQDCIGIGLTIGRDKQESVGIVREHVVNTLAERQGLNPESVGYSQLNKQTQDQIDQIVFAAVLPEVFEDLIGALEDTGISSEVFVGEVYSSRNSGVSFQIGGVLYENANGISGFTVTDGFATEQVSDLRIVLDTTKALMGSD